MSKVTIHGKEIKSIENLQSLLRVQLNLDESYVADINSMWDGLTSAASLPLTIEWLDFSVSREVLGDYAEQLMELMFIVEEELVELFTFIVNP